MPPTYPPDPDSPPEPPEELPPLPPISDPPLPAETSSLASGASPSACVDPPPPEALPPEAPPPPVPLPYGSPPPDAAQPIAMAVATDRTHVQNIPFELVAGDMDRPSISTCSAARDATAWTSVRAHISVACMHAADSAGAEPTGVAPPACPAVVPNPLRAASLGATGGSRVAAIARGQQRRSTAATKSTDAHRPRPEHARLQDRPTIPACRRAGNAHQSARPPSPPDARRYLSHVTVQPAGSTACCAACCTSRSQASRSSLSPQTRTSRARCPPTCTIGSSIARL
jgi:hypothetical protein